jgi:hypothetical protein
LRSRCWGGGETSLVLFDAGEENSRVYAGLTKSTDRWIADHNLMIQVPADANTPLNTVGR